MPLSLIARERVACPVCGVSRSGERVASGWDFEYGTTREEFGLVRYGGCGLIYLDDRPARQSVSVIYPVNYYSYSETKHENGFVKYFRDKLESGKIRVCADCIESKGPISIYDLGCGDGRLLSVMSHSFSQPVYLSGIEISDTAAAAARSKGYNVTSGDFEDYDLKSNSRAYDLIFMHQVLEHTREPRLVIRKIHAMLKNGGVLSLETPDTVSWDFFLFKRRYWGGYHIPRHFYLFNRASLCRLLVEEGFEIVTCKHLLSPVFWIHSIHNVLTEKRRFERLAVFFHYQNPFLLVIASFIDVIQVVFAKSSSNMQILARKKGP